MVSLGSPRLRNLHWLPAQEQPQIFSPNDGAAHVKDKQEDDHDAHDHCAKNNEQAQLITVPRNDSLVDKEHRRRIE